MGDHSQALLAKAYDSLLVVLTPAILEYYGGRHWGEGFGRTSHFGGTYCTIVYELIVCSILSIYDKQHFLCLVSSAFPISQ